MRQIELLRVLHLREGKSAPVSGPHQVEAGARIGTAGPPMHDLLRPAVVVYHVNHSAFGKGKLGTVWGPRQAIEIDDGRNGDGTSYLAADHNS